MTAASSVGQLPLDIVVAKRDLNCLLALLHSVPISMQKKLCPAAFLCDLDNPLALQLLLKSGISSADLEVDEVCSSLCTGGFRLNASSGLVQFATNANCPENYSQTLLCLHR